MYKYIYIYKALWCTLYLHWWSLTLQYQVAFWLTRQFQWNSYSKWQCNFQVTVSAQVTAMFFAYFMVICCISAQARQAFYRYNCLVRLLTVGVSFTWFCVLLVTMMNLYRPSLNLTHNHEYIPYQTAMVTERLPFYLQWHSKLPWNMKEKCSFWSKGEMEVPLEFANSCDQQVF